MTVSGNRPVKVRCIFCGDSQHNPNKKHLALNLVEGYYYCYRCHASGPIPKEVQLELLGSYSYDRPDQSLEQRVHNFQPGPYSNRYSALDRYHATLEDDVWDVFFSRVPSSPSAISGFLLRKPGLSRMIGVSGLGWPGAIEGQPITSHPDDPLIVVEGPYDVLTDRHVATWGLFTSRKLHLLKGHHIILCPDGDVWERPDLRHRFGVLIDQITRLRIPIFLEGIDLIPKGMDPDETKERIEFRGLQDITKLNRILKDERQPRHDRYKISSTIAPALR